MIDLRLQMLRSVAEGRVSPEQALEVLSGILGSSLSVSPQPVVKKKRANYSEDLSANIHVNTADRELTLVRTFAGIDLDPASNQTSKVDARTDWWGPRQIWREPCRRCDNRAVVDVRSDFIFCPRCQAAHLDLGEWFMRPHKTHLCDRCGNLWTPVDRYTRGVGSTAEVGLNQLPCVCVQHAICGLTTPWSPYVRPGKIVFVNHPYGNHSKPWIDKMNQEAANGVEIISLSPGRFDTKWFRGAKPQRVCWYRRASFFDATKPEQKTNAKFQSCFMYWGLRVKRFEEIFGADGNKVTTW